MSNQYLPSIACLSTTAAILTLIAIHYIQPCIRGENTNGFHASFRMILNNCIWTFTKKIDEGLDGCLQFWHDFHWHIVKDAYIVYI